VFGFFTTSIYENTFLRRLLLKITFFAHYTDQIYDMEKAIARKPRKFQIDIVGKS